MKLTAVIVTVLMVLLVGLPVPAQSIDGTKPSGKLTGIVLDPRADACIPGAKILLQRTDFQLEVISSEKCTYEIDLPVGIYKMTVSADGFSTRKLSVEIRLNLVTKQDVRLDWVVTDQDFIYHEPLRTDTPMLNTTIQLRPLRKP